MKLFLRSALLLFGLLILYFLSLLIAEAIPNGWVEKNAELSFKTLTAEGEVPVLWITSGGISLDNFTDNTMIRLSVQSSSKQGFISSTLDKRGGRYWHGFIVVLKPLLIFFQYKQIRFLLAVILFLLTACSTYLLKKRTNVYVALAYLLSLICVHIYIVPFSLNFSSVFIIMILALIALCLWPLDKYKWLPTFFLIVGSLTNFFDFLTAPLVTLGFPLVVYYCLQISRGNGREEVKVGIFGLFKFTFCWCVGYALTWATRWVLHWIFVGKGIWEDVGDTMLFRTMGNSDYVLNRVEMWKKNFNMLVSRESVFLALAIIICVIAVFLWHKRAYRGKTWLEGILKSGTIKDAALKSVVAKGEFLESDAPRGITLAGELPKGEIHKSESTTLASEMLDSGSETPKGEIQKDKTPKNGVLAKLPLLIIAVYPAVWVTVLASHSQIHSWFTYRIFSVSIFAMLVVFFSVLSYQSKDIRDKTTQQN